MYDSVPWEQLGQSVAPGGGQMTLRRCGRDYVIEVNDVELMASDRHDSEESLARMACEGLKASEPRVLIGGLGMGFTLRAALDALPSGAEVVVAELVPAVVAWNRTVLGHLAKHPLHDPRVRVAEGDVARVMMESSGYHVIMLDVDNGPSAFTQDSNNGLYDSLGLETIKSRLLPGGVLAVWSSDPDRLFEIRLAEAGFSCDTVSVKAGGKGNRARHTLFFARVGSSSQSLRTDSASTLDQRRAV